MWSHFILYCFLFVSSQCGATTRFRFPPSAPGARYAYCEVYYTQEYIINYIYLGKYKLI